MFSLRGNSLDVYVPFRAWRSLLDVCDCECANVFVQTKSGCILWACAIGVCGSEWHRALGCMRVYVLEDCCTQPWIHKGMSIVCACVTCRRVSIVCMWRNVCVRAKASYTCLNLGSYVIHVPRGHVKPSKAVTKNLRSNQRKGAVSVLQQGKLLLLWPAGSRELPKGCGTCPKATG